MKKSIAVIIILAFLLSCPVTAFAAAEEHVYDPNGNLSATEIARLNELAADIYSQYGFDILIDIDESVTENAVDYAERRYAEVGGADNGILLAITADKCYIHQVGEAETVFSEFHINFMWEKYDAEETYFDGVACYLLAAKVILKGLYDEQNAPDMGPPEIPDARQKPRLVDEAGLLTAAWKEGLLAKLDEISERQACDVAIVTVNSLDNKTAQAYADDYYDYNGYGMGDDDDGILLLISIDERDWAITTYGFAIPAFTDAGQAYIANKFKPNLSEGNYAAAFSLFAGLCDDFLLQAKTGAPYDKGHLPNSVSFGRGFLNLFTFFLPLGFIISMIITHFMKKKLKSVVTQKAANSYVRQGSTNITSSRDTFLHKTLSKTARASESSSSGGSSTHTSSSGR
ncbi:TPM domain-containing protein, partial [Christensenellaceae bacterium OttesenSCG-928-M15]|nr:TPM domain-containing protein [Christensenellaceae bacterium OttesenSCG-928-M15]